MGQPCGAGGGGSPPGPAPPEAAGSLEEELLDGLPAEPWLPLVDCCSGKGDSWPPALAVELVLGLPPLEPPGFDGGAEDGGDAGGCGSDGIELSVIPVHAASQHKEASMPAKFRAR